MLKICPPHHRFCNFTIFRLYNRFFHKEEYIFPVYGKSRLLVNHITTRNFTKRIPTFHKSSFSTPSKFIVHFPSTNKFNLQSFIVRFYILESPFRKESAGGHNNIKVTKNDPKTKPLPIGCESLNIEQVEKLPAFQLLQKPERFVNVEKVTIHANDPGMLHILGMLIPIGMIVVVLMGLEEIKKENLAKENPVQINQYLIGAILAIPCLLFVAWVLLGKRVLKLITWNMSRNQFEFHSIVPLIQKPIMVGKQDIHSVVVVPPRFRGKSDMFVRLKQPNKAKPKLYFMYAKNEDEAKLVKYMLTGWNRNVNPKH